VKTPINAESLLRQIVENSEPGPFAHMVHGGDLARNIVRSDDINAARLLLSRNPSDLRQYLNVLSEQLKSDSADRAVVFQTCKLIAMEAANAEKPLPDDVFAPGIDDRIARLMLSSACMMATQMATAPQVQGNRIVSRPNRPPINGS
jgi:hypothetical protein